MLILCRYRLFYNKVPARQFSSKWDKERDWDVTLLIVAFHPGYKLQNKIIVEDVYEDGKSDSKVDVVKDV